jgi:hypothetical protein
MNQRDTSIHSRVLEGLPCFARHTSSRRRGERDDRHRLEPNGRRRASSSSPVWVVRNSEKSHNQIFLIRFVCTGELWGK